MKRTEKMIQLEVILDHLGALVYTKDRDGCYTFVNQYVCDTFDCSEDQILGKPEAAFLDLTQYSDSSVNDRQVLETGEKIQTQETVMINKTGQVKTFWSVKVPLFDSKGAIDGLCGISTDISKRLRLERRLKKQNILMDTVLNNVDACVYMKDCEGRYQYLNQAMAALVGKPPGDVIGYKDSELLSPEHTKQNKKLAATLKKIGRKVSDEESWTGSNGEIRHHLSTKIPIFLEGRLESIVGISVDISEIVALREKFKFLANTDALTGVCSRRFLLELTQRELQRMSRLQDCMAVVIFDIDRFKIINDRFGHAVGDRVLVHLANLIKDNLRVIDLFGRLGGDEFVIAMPSIQLEDAKNVLERLRGKIQDISYVDDEVGQIDITSSFGMTLSCSENPVSLDDLLSRADKALYCAKNNGGNQVQVNELPKERK